jgi:hypothetical protein
MENFIVIQNNKYHNPLGRGKNLTDYTVIGEFDNLERAISCLGKAKNADDYDTGIYNSLNQRYDFFDKKFW